MFLEVVMRCYNLNVRADVYLGATTDVYLSATADVYLIATADVYLSATADVYLHVTADVYLNATADVYLSWIMIVWEEKICADREAYCTPLTIIQLIKQESWDMVC